MKHLDGVEVLLCVNGTTGDPVLEHPCLHDKTHAHLGDSTTRCIISETPEQPFKWAVDFADGFDLYDATGVKVSIGVTAAHATSVSPTQMQTWWIPRRMLSRTHSFNYLFKWLNQSSTRGLPFGWSDRFILPPQESQQDAADAQLGCIMITVQRGHIKQGCLQRSFAAPSDPPMTNYHCILLDSQHSVYSHEVIREEWFQALSGEHGQAYGFEFRNTTATGLEHIRSSLQTPGSSTTEDSSPPSTSRASPEPSPIMARRSFPLAGLDQPGPSADFDDTSDGYKTAEQNSSISDSDERMIRVVRLNIPDGPSKKRKRTTNEEPHSQRAKRAPVKQPRDLPEAPIHRQAAMTSREKKFAEPATSKKYLTREKLLSDVSRDQDDEEPPYSQPMANDLLPASTSPRGPIISEIQPDSGRAKAAMVSAGNHSKQVQLTINRRNQDVIDLVKDEKKESPFTVDRESDAAPLLPNGLPQPQLRSEESDVDIEDLEDQLKATELRIRIRAAKKKEKQRKDERNLQDSIKSGR